MIKIRNPYFTTPVNAKGTQHAPAVDAWLKTQQEKNVVTAGQIRAAMPAIAKDLNRQVINQICANLNLTIENPEDDEA